MGKERILVTVKTYPTLSEKYGELVCTAGFREDGTWVRIYPVPFRRLGESERYKKYDWIVCNLERRTADPRPESYRPIGGFSGVGHIDTKDKWKCRRSIVLGKARVYDNLRELIEEAKKGTTSLAVFKPRIVTDFSCKPAAPQWDEHKLAAMRQFIAQKSLFDDDSWGESFSVVEKVPYSFSYTFEDSVGKRSTLSIQDWEIGSLYWNCLRRAAEDKQTAVAKVREKYADEFMSKDLHFFVGTTLQWQHVGPNPFIIVGVFAPPKSKLTEDSQQLDLF